MSDRPHRIGFLVAGEASEVNAIRQYARCLAVELERSQGARVCELGPDIDVARAGALDALVVQYSPFSFGRWGFAPRLPVLLARLRRRTRVGVMVHEPFVSVNDWRSSLMGAWQRAQLRAMCLSAGTVLASIEPWADLLRRHRYARTVTHLPVGSNLPDRRDWRDQTRAQLGLDDDCLVLASLDAGHFSHMKYRVAQAAVAAAQAGRACALLRLGAGATPLAGLPPQTRVFEPGLLSAEALAAHLAAADVFLSPLIDGVSTRRTSVMAAMQHALPIITTVGALTDPELRVGGGGLSVTAATDRAGWEAAVQKLVLDPDARAAQGVAARQRFDRSFSWELIAERLIAALMP